MKKNLIMSILLNYIFLGYMVAQQSLYPRLQDVQVNVKISFNHNEQMFHYAYLITNGNVSTGKIDGLKIDITHGSNTVDIDTIGLQFENDGFTEGSFRRNFPHLKGRIIPVGFIKMPQNWSAGLSNDLVADFFTTRTYAIKQGQSLNGFEMMSKGLPSIRQCIVTPFFDFDSLFSEEIFPNEEDIPNTDSIQNAGKFYSQTIGPTAPPLNFIATVWCDTLLSYTHQSVALGWLKEKRDDEREDDERSDNGIVKNIEKRIEKARKEFVKGDSTKARQELEKLVKKVEKIYKKSEEAEKKKYEGEIAMTSEAYALLKYNTEYLIERLPEKKKDK